MNIKLMKFTVNKNDFFSQKDVDKTPKNMTNKKLYINFLIGIFWS